ncbi:hypothetical protein ACJX0J_037734, partial [Zea mays]
MFGQNIIEGVILHKKKLDGIILKLDFNKAYDKIKWDFLRQSCQFTGVVPHLESLWYCGKMPLLGLRKYLCLLIQFFWQGGQHKNKYRLGWLTSLSRTFLLNEDGIWQQILKNKYLGTKALTHVSRRLGDSQFCWGQAINNMALVANVLSGAIPNLPVYSINRG